MGDEGIPLIPHLGEPLRGRPARSAGRRVAASIPILCLTVPVQLHALDCALAVREAYAAAGLVQSGGGRHVIRSHGIVANEEMRHHPSSVVIEPALPVRPNRKSVAPNCLTRNFILPSCPGAGAIRHPTSVIKLRTPSEGRGIINGGREARPEIRVYRSLRRYVMPTTGTGVWKVSF